MISFSFYTILMLSICQSVIIELDQFGRMIIGSAIWIIIVIAFNANAITVNEVSPALVLY